MIDKSQIGVRQHVPKQRMNRSQEALGYVPQKTMDRRQNTGGLRISEGHVSLDRGRVCSRFEKRMLSELVRKERET
jgi:hypothetical protein